MTYIPQKSENIASTTNNSTTPLNDGIEFVGTAELNDYSSVSVQVTTDQDGELRMEFSPDGVNWDTSLKFNYKDGQINAPKWLVKFYRYFRVKFLNNSGANQTFLRLYTYYSDGTGQLVAPINGTLSETYDATVVRPTDYKNEVAMGRRQGRETWNKFGYNKDIDTANEEIIASYGTGPFDPTTDIMNTAQTFTISYNNTTDGSGQTGATGLQFYYLDANFELQVGIHFLGATGSDVTSFSGLGINRIVVISNGGAGFNNNDITVTATVDGTTQAQIPAQNSTTQQCIFHTPINWTYLADWVKINTTKLSGGGGSPLVTIRGYSWSRVTSTRYNVLEIELDSAVENTVDFSTPQPFVIGGREVLYFTGETDVNNTHVSVRFSGILERNS